MNLADLRDVKRLIRIFLHRPAKPAQDHRVVAQRRPVFTGLPNAEALDQARGSPVTHAMRAEQPPRSSAASTGESIANLTFFDLGTESFYAMVGAAC